MKLKLLFSFLCIFGNFLAFSQSTTDFGMTYVSIKSMYADRQIYITSEGLQYRTDDGVTLVTFGFDKNKICDSYTISVALFVKKRFEDYIIKEYGSPMDVTDNGSKLWFDNNGNVYMLKEENNLLNFYVFSKNKVNQLSVK